MFSAILCLSPRPLLEVRNSPQSPVVPGMAFPSPVSLPAHLPRSATLQLGAPRRQRCAWWQAVSGDVLSIWDRAKLSVARDSSAGSLLLGLPWLCLRLLQGLCNCTCFSYVTLQHCWALHCGIQAHGCQQTGQAMLRAGLWPGTDLTPLLPSRSP